MEKLNYNNIKDFADAKLYAQERGGVPVVPFAWMAMFCQEENMAVKFSKALQQLFTDSGESVKFKIHNVEMIDSGFRATTSVGDYDLILVRESDSQNDTIKVSRAQIIEPKEEPVVAPKEAPKEEPKEEPVVAPKEAPKEEPNEEPVVAPKEEVTKYEWFNAFGCEILSYQETNMNKKRINVFGYTMLEWN